MFLMTCAALPPPGTQFMVLQKQERETDGQAGGKGKNKNKLKERGKYLKEKVRILSSAQKGRLYNTRIVLKG